MRQDKKDKTISAVSTLLIMLFCLLLCSWLGYKLPNPPIEEEGMGVAGEVLGEIEGFGNNDQATFDNSSAAAPSASTPEDSYTTGEEPTPVAKTTKTDEKPQPTKNPDPAKPTNNTNTSTSETPQPVTNPNATFKGRHNGNGGEGKGTATGSGQAGSPDGTQGAQGGTGKGNGAGYSLGGRSLRGTLPVPRYTSTKDGDVTVSIKVDRNGNVITAEFTPKGSKNYDQSMVNAAIDAAKKAHFNADPNATEYQYGTITYKFRRQG